MPEPDSMTDLVSYCTVLRAVNTLHLYTPSLVTSLQQQQLLLLLQQLQLQLQLVTIRTTLFMPEPDSVTDLVSYCTVLRAVNTLHI